MAFSNLDSEVTQQPLIFIESWHGVIKIPWALDRQICIHSPVLLFLAMSPGQSDLTSLQPKVKLILITVMRIPLQKVCTGKTLIGSGSENIGSEYELEGKT